MRGKKLISLTLCALLSLSTVTAFAAVNFNDIDASHWAYPSVMELVNDGTVKGYDDGGFHPNGTVTRAEFSKMIGKGKVVRETDFDDVPKDHWGYDYIMSSGLKIDGNAFLPDQPILRGEVMEMIWSRNGEVKNCIAPGAVTSQWNNPDAIAWGYSYGIMIGDNGLNLRLDQPLTRAEAAALITRGRNYASATPVDFEKIVSEETLRIILNQTDLIDGDLSDLSRKITNGELAMAAMRLEVGEYEPIIVGYPSDASAEQFGTEWALVAKNYLGRDDYQKTVNDIATLQDAFATIAMATAGKCSSKDGVEIDMSGYPGAKTSFALGFAKGLGLQFNSKGTIDNRELTLADLAKLLVQVDQRVGIKVSYKNNTKQDEKIQKVASNYPSNASFYPTIIESVPKNVYEAEWLIENPSIDYEFTRTFYSIFTETLDKFSGIYDKKGFPMTFTFYPSLTVHNGKNQFAFRVYMNVKAMASQVTFKSLFGDNYIGEDCPVKSGFVEIKTGTALSGTVYDEQNLIITKVID